MQQSIHGTVMEWSVRVEVSMHTLWRGGSTQEHTAGGTTFTQQAATGTPQCVAVQQDAMKQTVNISSWEQREIYFYFSATRFHYVQHITNIHEAHTFCVLEFRPPAHYVTL